MLRKPPRLRRANRVRRVDAYGAFRLNVVRAMTPVGARVDDDERLTSRLEFLELTDRDALGDV
jgi:hypothetical protein